MLAVPEPDAVACVVPLAEVLEVALVVILADALVVTCVLAEVFADTEVVPLSFSEGSLGNAIFTLGHKHCGGRKGMNKHRGPQGDRSVACMPVVDIRALANAAKRFAILGKPGIPPPPNIFVTS